MLERIRNCPGFRAANLLLLSLTALALTSCATKEEPELVSSGAGRETALPWNQQQSWEGTGQFGALAEGMNEGRR